MSRKTIHRIYTEDKGRAIIVRVISNQSCGSFSYVDRNSESYPFNMH